MTVFSRRYPSSRVSPNKPLLPSLGSRWRWTPLAMGGPLGLEAVTATSVAALVVVFLMIELMLQGKWH